MADKSIMTNHASGWMCHRQYPVRSMLAIREQCGVLLTNGDEVETVEALGLAARRCNALLTLYRIPIKVGMPA